MTDKNVSTEPAKANPNQIEVACREGEDPTLPTTRVLISPSLTNANITAIFATRQFGRDIDLSSVVTALGEIMKRVQSNDLKDVEATLVCQATTLNSMFCELSRRAALNMGEYIDASERYLRMALKAQNQCRMTLETLSNIKNPPVVYAKQANISNGPQQVNNTLHVHASEKQNPPSKLLEATHEAPMDAGTKGSACPNDSPMEAVAEINRPENK